MKPALLILLLVAGCLTTLVGQEPAPAPPPATPDGDHPAQAKGRVFWLVATSIPEGVSNPITVLIGKELVEVTLSKRSISLPVETPDDGIVRIVHKAVDPIYPDKFNYSVIAQMVIAKEIQNAMIILVPAPKNANGHVFQAKVQDLAGFQGGDWMYINLTNRSVGIEMGESKMLVKAGDVKILKIGNVAEAVNVPLRYSVSDENSEHWKLLSASTVVVQPTRREICIFSVDGCSDRVNYHGVTFPVVR